jgi:hypothetical protein
MMKDKFGQQNVPLIKATPDDGYYVQTYFDVTPFSPSQRYLALSKLPFQDHVPTLGDIAEVCIIDLEEETVRTVYRTQTWGFQTGTNVQWGASDRYVYTNDLINDKAVMVEIDLETGRVRAADSSMYNVSRNGTYAIGFPVELLNATQQGYGMPSREVNNPPKLDPGAATDQGVWRTDLKTLKSDLLYSVADVAGKVPEPPPRPGGTFYFWHSKYNRQVTRIMQVLRCIYPGFDGVEGRNPMLFTLDADGKNVYFTHHDPVWDFYTGGHPNWHPDGVHIIRNLKPDRKVTRVCQFRYDGADFHPLSETFKSSGHPSIESSGRFVITDNREPDNLKQDRVSLIMLDVETDKVSTLCRLPTIRTKELKGVYKTMRLDGHPCWSRDYKKVTLQATYQGARQIFIADLSDRVG